MSEKLHKKTRYLQYGVSFSGKSYRELKVCYDDYCMWCQHTLNTVPSFNAWSFQMIINGYHAWHGKNKHNPQ